MDWLSPDVSALGATGAYLVVPVLVLVESGIPVGFLLPGDTVLFAAGLLAGDPGSGVRVGVVVALVTLAAVVGEALGYATGARLGRPWLDRRVASGRLDPRHLRRADSFFRRFGWWAVLAARWVPWARTFVPLLAGSSGMPLGRFASANLVGALTWAAGLVLVGYAAAGDPRLGLVAGAVAACAVAGSLLAALLLRRHRR
jgi:membrane-associated protein